MLTNSTCSIIHFFSSYSPARSFSCPDSAQGANRCDEPFTKQWIRSPSSYTKYEGHSFISALHTIHTIQLAIIFNLPLISFLTSSSILDISWSNNICQCHTNSASSSNPAAACSRRTNVSDRYPWFGPLPTLQPRCHL